MKLSPVNRRRTAVLGATAVLTAALVGATTTTASASSTQPAPGHRVIMKSYRLDGTLLHRRATSTSPSAAASSARQRLSAAIPSHSLTNTDQSTKKTYTDTYVGAAPSSNSSTTVAVNIVPLTLRLQNANGSYTTVSSTSSASSAAGSPLFTNTATKPVGESTQYLDGYLRANWNKTSSSYHLKLTGAVQSAVTVTFSYYDWQSQGGTLLLNDAVLTPAI